MRALAVLILFLFLSCPASAQSMIVYRYSEEEGLENTLIKSITRDNYGIIWAATDDGLVSYDGKEFHFYHDEVPSQYCKSVLNLPEGEVLVTSDMGVSRISGNPGNYIFSTIASGSLHQNDSMMWFPKQLYRDSKGRVWIGDNYRIYQLRKGILLPYKLDASCATNNYNRSFSFCEDGNGHLLAFAEPGNILIFDEPANKFVNLKLPSAISGIHAVLNYSKGIILVASREGVYELKTNNPDGVGIRLISKDEVSYFARNSKGVTYAGTWSNGLFRIQSAQPGSYVLDRVTEYVDKNVTHIFIDGQDNLWISSDNGIVLMQETLFGTPFRDFTLAYIQGISSNQKNEVVFTDGNNLFKEDPLLSGNGINLFRFKSLALQAIPVNKGYWVSDADGKIFLLDDNQRKIKEFDFSSQGRAIFKLLLDRSGNLWACQDANEQLICIQSDFKTRLYGKRDGLTSRIIALSLTPKGEVVCGGMTDTAFLFRYNPVQDRFLNLSQPLQFERNIDLNVNDIVGDDKGALWLATSFGLVLSEKGRMNRVNLGAFTANSIKAIAIDKLGYIWFANNKGLHRYKNGDLMSFDEKNGLSSKTIGYRCLMVDDAGRLWVGTVAGVSVSGPLKGPEPTETPVIHSIQINNHLVRDVFTKLVSINNNEFVSLKVVSPQFPVKNIRYEYKVEGIDTAWISISREDHILLSDLPPGKYKLIIRARQSGNYSYSKPLEWLFEVNRVWYERWWVILLSILAIIGIIWLNIILYSRKLRIDNLRLEESIRVRTMEIQLQNERIEQQNTDIVQKNEALSLKNIELEQAKNYAEEAARAKAQFLSIMSHEIRTPMNAVIGITHLLMRNNPRPEQFEDLKILKFSAENLLGLINDVLDLNKIEAGKLEIERTEFNLKNLVIGLCSSLHYKAIEKGITLNIDFDDQIPVYVQSDPLRLSQIINNLAGNAIKFTEEGSVDVSVRLISRDEQKLNIRFGVADTGVGIPSEMHEKIFDAFTQASSETSRKFGGTGLGLAIANGLLEAMGSGISMKSEPGIGSTFFFEIEMLAGRPTIRSAEMGLPENILPQFQRQSILLVEDNLINELIARKLMEDWNLVVDSAANGGEAVTKASEKHYQLILMDLQMPGMDGYQATKMIREQNPVNKMIPIIALTASSRNEVHEKVLKSGMNGYILKPFDPAELYNKLRLMLG